MLLSFRYNIELHVTQLPNQKQNDLLMPTIYILFYLSDDLTTER